MRLDHLLSMEQIESWDLRVESWESQTSSWRLDQHLSSKVGASGVTDSTLSSFEGIIPHRDESLG